MSDSSHKDPFSTLRILIVDEDSEKRRTLIRLLKKIGYSCDAIAIKDKCMEALRRQLYDVVFISSDPSDNVYEDLVHEIRESEGEILELSTTSGKPDTEPLKLIALVEREKDYRHFRAALNRGFDEVLYLPLEAEELKAKLEQCLERNSDNLESN